MAYTKSLKAAPATVKPQPLPTYDHCPTLTAEMAVPADRRHTDLMQVLYNALTVKRGHGSVEEARFVTWMSKRYAATLIDGAGNLHFDLRIGADSRTLFTSHTDTVHHSSGVNTVKVDGKFWRAHKAALGADDGAGIALLAHLMSHKVPGYYIMFRGEECGGIGSSWLAENMPELLSEFDRAVAFDRAGYYDVITHQGGSRCCSDAFANALAVELSTDDHWFLPSDGGVYTDTAEFVSIIPECTNVSVGYKSQHGDREEQDVEFLQKLADQLVKVQWDTLPTQRDPKVYQSKWTTSFNDKLYDTKQYWHDKPSHRDTGYDTATWATVPNAYDIYADLEDGAAEEDLMYALEEARENLNTSYLLRLVAELVYPEDPEMVRVDRSRLTAAMIHNAILSLQQGFDAVTVAQDLYTDLFPS